MLGQRGLTVGLASATTLFVSPIAPALAISDSAKDAVLLLDGRLTQTLLSPTVTWTVLLFGFVWLYFSIYKLMASS